LAAALRRSAEFVQSHGLYVLEEVLHCDETTPFSSSNNLYYGAPPPPDAGARSTRSGALRPFTGRRGMTGRGFGDKTVYCGSGKQSWC